MRWGLLLSSLLFAGSAAAASELAGRASVIDGDTIQFRSERIRLQGIDAPESGQWCLDDVGEGYRCGQRAALVLDDQIGAQNVRCELLGRDQYGRHIGRCFLGGFDFNGWMVRRAHAVAYRRFSTEYVAAENAARQEGAGI